MTPGATDNARWMVKAIYFLKIYICFRVNILLLQGKKKNCMWHLYMDSFELQVAFIYGQFGIMLH